VSSCKGQSPTNSDRTPAGRPLQWCRCKYSSRGMRCLSRSKSSAMMSTHLPASGYEPSALVPRQGWWVRQEKIPPVSEAQRPRPEDLQKGKHGGPRQAQRAVNELFAASQPLLHSLERASQIRKRGRGIQAAAPAAESGRVRNAIRIFQRWSGAFPGAVLHKTSPQCLTARDQAVMGIGQGESGKKRESQFAESAEPAAIINPVMTVVMCLLAPPAMTDDRIAQTEGTPGKDPFPASHPVEARLAMVRRKWDNGDRTAWEALSLSRIFDGWCPEESLPPSCSTSAHEG
jgi:hypothetical protein